MHLCFWGAEPLLRYNIAVRFDELTWAGLLERVVRNGTRIQGLVESFTRWGVAGFTWACQPQAGVERGKKKKLTTFLVMTGGYSCDWRRDPGFASENVVFGRGRNKGRWVKTGRAIERGFRI